MISAAPPGGSRSRAAQPQLADQIEERALHYETLCEIDKIVAKTLAIPDSPGKVRVARPH